MAQTVFFLVCEGLPDVLRPTIPYTASLQQAQRLQRAARGKLEDIVRHLDQFRGTVGKRFVLGRVPSRVGSAKMLTLRMSLQAYNVGVFAVNLQRWKDQQRPQ